MQLNQHVFHSSQPTHELHNFISNFQLSISIFMAIIFCKASK